MRACGLIQPELRQLSFLPEEERAQRRETLEAAMDGIRSRYGHFSIQRGVMLTDKALSNLNPKADHVLHPVGLLK